MLTLDLKIASVMHISSSNFGKKQQFWTFFSRFLQLCLMSLVPNWDDVEMKQDGIRHQWLCFWRLFSRGGEWRGNTGFFFDTRTKSLFQIMYHHVTKGRNKTPVHIMNGHTKYELCRNCELIRSFKRQSTCISYKAMKELRKDLPKHSLANSECNLPLSVILTKIVSC